MTHHVHATIEHLLKLSDEELGKMFDMNGAEARKQLEERAAKGELLIGSEHCVGFDPVKGCPGHEEKKIKMQPGKIYYVNYGGMEIVGRYKDTDVCNHLWYDYLKNWSGFESYYYNNNLYTVKHGITEIREATMTEKQALLRKSLEYNTI
jgi:hypothetical protein